MYKMMVACLFCRDRIGSSCNRKIEVRRRSCREILKVYFSKIVAKAVVFCITIIMRP